MKTYTIIILFIFTLGACTQAPPPSPSCRVQVDFEDRHQGFGACLVRIQNGLLAVQAKRSEALDLPRGDFISPETSQCGAHRHMWEQTGLNVEVAQLLGVNREGLRIYACHLGGGFDGTEVDIKPPDWGNSMIKSFGFIDPFVTRYDEWQHSKDLILIRDAYVAQGFTKVKTDQEIYQAGRQNEQF